MTMINKNLKIEKSNIFDIYKIKEIYMESFSKENRFSFFMLIFNLLLKKSENYVLKENNEIVAFLYVIIYQNQRFILYLAVKENKRNDKLGTYLLSWYVGNNKNCDIYLNIDEVNSKFDDYFIRQKRLDFYLRNGFYLTDYLSANNGINGNILSTKDKFVISEYRALDKRISRYFFCKRDKIVKKDI